MTGTPFEFPVDPSRIYFSPFDLVADDANEHAADALRGRRPGLVSTSTTFTLGGFREVEVEYVPQTHPSDHGWITARCTSARVSDVGTVVETFRRQDDDEDHMVVRIGTAIADWLLGEP